MLVYVHKRVEQPSVALLRRVEEEEEDNDGNERMLALADEIKDMSYHQPPKVVSIATSGFVTSYVCEGWEDVESEVRKRVS